MNKRYVHSRESKEADGVDKLGIYVSMCLEVLEGCFEVGMVGWCKIVFRDNDERASWPS